VAGKYFVDTNILIYAHDASKGAKYRRARELVDELWATGTGVLSTQVLQELCVNLRRKAKLPYSMDEMRSLIRDYKSWHVVVNNQESLLRALEIEDRYQISFWDALILQAAESAGAETVYSEDLSAGQQYGSIQVVNPLMG
jgi:predicted nucleic acid-binding protein